MRLRSVIFRVAKEAMTNSVRHGRRKGAKISLDKGSGRIEFMAQDVAGLINRKGI